MIKDLLVNLSVDAKNDTAIPYAISLADAFEAHVTAVAFAYEAIVPIGFADAAVSVEFIEAQREERQKAADAAKQRFERDASVAGIATSESQVMWASLAGAADQFGLMARRFDLSVVMQPEPDATGPEELVVEAALFQTGRPVIVVPYIQKDGFKTNRIMVCWDGGRSAARAVADALPVLKRAGKVEVVTITEAGKRNEIPGADIGQHLARHGVNIEIKPIVAAGDVQTALLSYAADSSADMMVMGGYGHSRLREFILGGVTREMLKSMTVPCLMSH